MTERTETPTATRDWATLSDEARAAMAKILSADVWGNTGHGRVVVADQCTP